MCENWGGGLTSVSPQILSKQKTMAPFFFGWRVKLEGGGLTSVPPQILSNIGSSHNITQDKGRVILFSTLSATAEKMNEAIIRRKLYLKKNAKHIRQVAQAYRHRNREKIRVWERRYREKNRELIRTRNRTYQKRYKQRHKEKIQEYQRIYRAKKGFLGFVRLC